MYEQHYVSVQMNSMKRWIVCLSNTVWIPWRDELCTPNFSLQRLSSLKGSQRGHCGLTRWVEGSWVCVFPLWAVISAKVKCFVVSCTVSSLVPRLSPMRNVDTWPLNSYYPKPQGSKVACNNRSSRGPGNKATQLVCSVIYTAIHVNKHQ